MIPVIICGGVGTKMWPESSLAHPKHFLPLVGGKSLFRLCLDQLKSEYRIDKIFVSTNVNQAKMVLAQAPEINKDNLILEPELKNHGPATGLVAAFLAKRGLKDEPFMLVQPDDIREPREMFLKMLKMCDSLARETDKYITGGIKPDYAVMGVDYLIKGERVLDDEIGVYKVDKFLWRSTKEAAEEYVGNGKALVHANHTCMTPVNFLKMYQKYKPEWYRPLMDYVNGGDLSEVYSRMPKGPIEDVTQMVFEAGESLVVELPFRWTDIGTWESLANYVGTNNDSSSQAIEIEGQHNFVRSKKPVAIIGLSDLCVIENEDGVLVCPKKESGKVGEVVKALETKNPAK